MPPSVLAARASFGKPTLDCRECLQKDLFSYNTSFSAVAVAELLSKFNEQQNQECAKTLRL